MRVLIWNSEEPIRSYLLQTRWMSWHVIIWRLRTISPVQSTLNINWMPIRVLITRVSIMACVPHAVWTVFLAKDWATVLRPSACLARYTCPRWAVSVQTTSVRCVPLQFKEKMTIASGQQIIVKLASDADNEDQTRAIIQVNFNELEARTVFK